MTTPCACAEFTRIAIGPLEIPVGLMPLIMLIVAVAILPGIIKGMLNRRRFANAIRDGQPARRVGPAGDEELVGP